MKESGYMKHALAPGLVALFVTTTLHAATVDLRILETTDLHSNMMDFDYYKDTPTDKFGLVRTASLIQGSPLGDYMAAKGLQQGEVHPVYLAMNRLDYAVGNIGNHEFNYGLDYLHKALSGAALPYVNDNVLDAKTGKPLFTPYLIKDTPVKDRDGKTHTLRIGYIGFVPPQIMVWDKANLSGKVTVADITETSKKWVPEMRQKGADIVVAIPHSGLSGEPYKAMAENSVYYLSQIPGINAILFGHAHAVFPSKDFAAIPGSNIAQGTLNGIPAVMPGQWGDHLGIVDLVVNNDSGQWQVTEGKAQARPIFDKAQKQSRAEADKDLVNVLSDAHQQTRTFVGKPIGKAADNMYRYLSLVQDDPTVQIVNNAQRAYVQHFIQGDPDLADIPVLSAATPFKAGGRKNDPNSYVEVEKGELTFRNAADLYLYPNTLVVVKVNGQQVKEWLECSAGQFNQIDVHSKAPQSLINWDGFRTYNFDVIDGVNYQIDVTQPARYDGECAPRNLNAERIVNLTYQGKPIDPKMTFLIATNNYRAYGEKFAGTGEKYVAFASPDENRSVLAAYISAETQKQGEVKPQADNNWRLAKIKSDTPLDIRMETAPSAKAAAFIKEKAQYPMTSLGHHDVGFALYCLDLQKQ